MEVIGIRHVVRTEYEKVEVVDKKGFWGMGKRSHTEIITKSEPMSYGKVTGIVGKDEPAVALTYVTTKPYTGNKPENEWNNFLWSDHTGRTGQKMIAEIMLPESMAIEVEKTINDNPVIIRQIVERIMKEQILKNPEVWEKGNNQIRRSPLRPPWERWDAEGGQIYIQLEQGKFDPNQLRRANR